MYVFVGPHPDTLADGTPLALGQQVKRVDLGQPHNERLVEKGWLVEQSAETPSPDPEPKATRPRRRPTPDQETT